jgi:hypothetical protein
MFPFYTLSFIMYVTMKYIQYNFLSLSCTVHNRTITIFLVFQQLQSIYIFHYTSIWYSDDNSCEKTFQGTKDLYIKCLRLNAPRDETPREKHPWDETSQSTKSPSEEIPYLDIFNLHKR